MFSNGLIHPEAKESDTYNYKLLEKKEQTGYTYNNLSRKRLQLERETINYVLAVEIIYG